MRGKSMLVLLEICVMLLVLALAAGLCLQAFAWAQQRAWENGLKDEATVQLQSTGEVLKHCRGDLDAVIRICGGSLDGEKWTLENAAYTLSAVLVETDNPYLGEAKLAVIREGNVLTELTVCWQEGGHG